MKVKQEVGVFHTEWQGYGITTEEGVRRNECSVGMWSNQHTAGEFRIYYELSSYLWMLLSCFTFRKGSMLPGLDHNQNG